MQMLGVGFWFGLCEGWHHLVLAISLWPMGKTSNGQLLLLLLYIHTQQKNIPTLLINLDIYGLYLLDSISICLNFTLTQGRVIVLK
jgi:hypothetical protein